MRPVLIYSGTTEGRELAECLAEAHIPCIVCVATEYGRLVMPPLEGVRILEGRMNVEQMRMLAQSENVRVVVDATHPYATEVTENIKMSVQKIHTVGGQAAELAQRLGRRNGENANEVPYLRLLRQIKEEAEWKNVQGIHWMTDHGDCVEKLCKKEGNILLTVGSKELMHYSSASELKDRLYVRVLPGVESLLLCEKCGMRGKQVIAMQGPFSKEMNKALMMQYDIRSVVTKESGSVGGFAEKLQAAQEIGADCYIIKSPKEEDGYDFAEILLELSSLLGCDIKDVAERRDPGFVSHGSIRVPQWVPETFTDQKSIESEKNHEPKGKTQQEDKDNSSNRKMQENEKEDTEQLPPPKGFLISLIGIGMGNPDTMTIGAKKALKSADYVYGAARMIEGIPKCQHPQPIYLPKDILPQLEMVQKECVEKGLSGARIAILFSGDSGFYSGCRKLKEALIEAGYAKIKIYPGISSVSYLSAACGESWEDGIIISTHGRTQEDWRSEAIETVRYHKKVFLLMANVANVRKLGQVLLESGLEECMIQLGYQLSYAQEQVLTCTPGQCTRRKKEGLYTCLVLNPSPDEKKLTHGMEDTEFERGDVPMTKEEVRSLVISKLHLTENAIVYDIGSGTGSIAVEIAALSAGVSVYAIERKANAADLIRRNCLKHHTGNVRVVEGEAPEALEELPVPTHTFIGGSSGKLTEILNQLYRKNPCMRVVMTAISLETIAQMQQLAHIQWIHHLQIIQIQVSRANNIGEYQLMRGENPVFIASFDFKK